MKKQRHRDEKKRKVGRTLWMTRLAWGNVFSRSTAQVAIAEEWPGEPVTGIDSLNKCRNETNGLVFAYALNVSEDFFFFFFFSSANSPNILLIINNSILYIYMTSPIPLSQAKQQTAPLTFFSPLQLWFFFSLLGVR